MKFLTTIDELTLLQNNLGIMGATAGIIQICSTTKFNTPLVSYL